MNCQKTGAQIYLAEYGAYALCDAFYDFGNGAYLFRIVKVDYKEPIREDQFHYTIHKIGHWFDKTGSAMKASTMYCRGEDVTFHGMEGNENH